MVKQRPKVVEHSMWRKVEGEVLKSPKGAQYVWRRGFLSLKARLIGVPLKIANWCSAEKGFLTRMTFEDQLPSPLIHSSVLQHYPS